MALSGDMLNVVLALEAMEELKVDQKTLTQATFDKIVQMVVKKFTLLPRETSRGFSEADTSQDDDELRNFFLGKRFCIEQCKTSCI